MNRSFLRGIFKPLSIEDRMKLVAEIRPMASPGFDFFFLTVLSCSIATLGLIINSPTVIIGAMLVAPLMSPIIGIGLASIIGDTHLLNDALRALIRGAVLAVALSAVVMRMSSYFAILSSQQSLPSEIVARTHPSPVDLGIALAGGLAAAYAITQPHLSAALPGVAIATALMPPLCTIGIGVSLGRWDVAGGALLLFLTNAVTIAFSAVLVFFLRGLGRSKVKDEPRLPRSLLLSAALTLALFIPLNIFGVRFFQEAAQNRRINNVVLENLEGIRFAELVDLSTKRQAGEMEIDITLRTSQLLSYPQVVDLQKAIVDEIDLPAAVRVNQIFAERLDPLIPPTHTFTPTITHTATAGASPTATHTRQPIATDLPTASATPSPTGTASPTTTPTRTPEPQQARVVQTGVPRMQIYQSPGGPVIGSVLPGQTVIVLYGEQIESGLVWVEIMDEEGRIGWVPRLYLDTNFIPTETSASVP